MSNYIVTKEIEQEVKAIVELYNNKETSKSDTIRYLMKVYHGQTAKSCQRISFNSHGCSIEFKNSKVAILNYTKLVEITKDQLTLF